MFDPDEDFRTPIESRRRLGHNYLLALAPLALVVAVVGFAVLGRSPAGSTASPATATSVPTAVAAATPSASAAAETATTLPALAESEPAIAAVGNRVFYTVNGVRIESVVSGQHSAPVTVVGAAPCEQIDQLAADAQTLVYVSTKRGTPTIDSCTPRPTVEWTIWALDVSSGDRHRLAAGTRLVTERDTAQTPVHIAVAEGRYAFDRVPEEAATDPSVPATIEVHALATNALVWKSDVGDRIQSLMLGGNKLVIMTSGWGMTQVFLDRQTMRRLSGLELISSESTGASLSADGRYLVWDAGEPAPMRSHSTLMLTDLQTGETRNLGLSIGSPGSPRIEPAVSATPAGPVVAWHAPRPDGEIAVRVVDPVHPGGTWLDSVSTMAWMSVEGESIVWAASDADGAETAQRVDLASRR